MSLTRELVKLICRREVSDADLQAAALIKLDGVTVGKNYCEIWHNTATCGPYGSAMAAAYLLDLDEDQTVHALGNAGTQFAGLWQFLDTGAMSKHLHAGRGAEAGMLAADLASYGFTGPPEILEGAQGFFAAACLDAIPVNVLEQPDAPWQLTIMSIKPWPSCRHTHPTIDCALDIREAFSDAAQIDAINIETHGVALNVCNRPLPDNDYAAKFSPQHCVSAALADNEVTFLSFDGTARDRLVEFRDKVNACAIEPWLSAYPVSWRAEVTVTMKDGRQMSPRRENCKVDPVSPLIHEQMTDKARMLLQHVGFDEDGANALIKGILDMTTDGAVPDAGLLAA